MATSEIETTEWPENLMKLNFYHDKQVFFLSDFVVKFMASPVFLAEGGA